GRNGGALGDAHELKREVAVKNRGASVVFDLCQLHCAPSLPGEHDQKVSMRISCGLPTMKPSSAICDSASRTVASMVECVSRTTVRAVTPSSPSSLTRKSGRWMTLSSEISAAPMREAIAARAPGISLAFSLM